jgi:hypothetical protein
VLPFFFSIEVKPTPATPKAEDIAGGIASVFVIADSLQEAEAKARSYLMDYAWIAEEVESFAQPSLDIIAQLENELQLLHEKAVREGIAADFQVWPKKARPHNTPTEVRLMGPPLRGSSDQGS